MGSKPRSASKWGTLESGMVPLMTRRHRLGSTVTNQECKRCKQHCHYTTQGSPGWHQFRLSLLKIFLYFKGRAEGKEEVKQLTPRLAGAGPYPRPWSPSRVQVAHSPTPSPAHIDFSEKQRVPCHSLDSPYNTLEDLTVAGHARVGLHLGDNSL